MKKYFVAILLLLIVLMTGCSGTTSPSEGDNIYTPETVNSEENLYSLAYDAQLSLEEVLDQYEVDNVRYLDNGVAYAVLHDNNGGTLFKEFSENEDGEYVNAGYYWYSSGEVLSEDFDKLIIGQNTLSDVEQLDPHGDYIEFYRSLVVNPINSYHLTYDGYFATVSYEYENKVIISVEKEKAPEDHLINIILDEDMPNYNNS